MEWDLGCRSSHAAQEGPPCDLWLCELPAEFHDFSLCFSCLRSGFLPAKGYISPLVRFTPTFKRCLRNGGILYPWMNLSMCDLNLHLFLLRDFLKVIGEVTIHRGAGCWVREALTVSPKIDVLLFLGIPFFNIHVQCRPFCWL